MIDERQQISIVLSPAQIDEIVRAAADSRAPSVSTLIGDALRAPIQTDDHDAGAALDTPSDRPPRNGSSPEPAQSFGFLPLDTADPRLSRSLLRGLSILTCFAPDGRERGIVELASDLGMSPSTAHRYAFTLVELGLLERCPKTRKYRLPGT